MTDLVLRLQEAAAAAIANERPSLENPAGNVRGITIELMLSSTGQVHEAACYVERRTTAGALLARKTRGRTVVGKGTGGANDQPRPSASVRVTGESIEVRCKFAGMQIPLANSRHPLGVRISQAVFAHERQCGQCETAAAYQLASTESLQRLMREKAEEPPA